MRCIYTALSNSLKATQSALQQSKTVHLHPHCSGTRWDSRPFSVNAVVLSTFLWATAVILSPQQPAGAPWGQTRVWRWKYLRKGPKKPAKNHLRLRKWRYCRCVVSPVQLSSPGPLPAGHGCFWYVRTENTSAFCNPTRLVCQRQPFFFFFFASLQSKRASCLSPRKCCCSASPSPTQVSECVCVYIYIYCILYQLTVNYWFRVALLSQ